MPVDHKAEERAKLVHGLVDFDDGAEERHTNTNYPTQEFVRAQMLYGIFGDPAPGGWGSGYFYAKSSRLAAIMWSVDRKEKQNAREQFVQAMFSQNPQGQFGYSSFPQSVSIEQMQADKGMWWGKRKKQLPGGEE